MNNNDIKVIINNENEEETSKELAILQDLYTISCEEYYNVY